MGCFLRSPFFFREPEAPMIEPLTTSNFSRPEKFPSFQFKTVHSLLPGSQIINNFSIHEVFKVLSFNVLADAYVGNHFPYCEPEFKEFSYRGPQIVKFIEVLNPDIFCLQEVDHYQDFYQPALSNKYSLYHEIQDPWLNVGLMIGLKKEKYELLKKSVISFDIYVTAEMFDEKEINKFKKGRKALILELQSIKYKQKYVIVNTHLHWNPTEEDVKQFEMINLMQFIENRYTKSDEVIICGDFNSLPESDQVQFVLKPSFLGPENNNMWQKCDIRNKRLRFGSAYGRYRQKNKRNLHPSFTNLTADFRGVLDYIFFNKRSKLELKRVLKIPKAKELVALPNKSWPSDHVPIMAEFLIEKWYDRNHLEEIEGETEPNFINL